MLKSVCKPLTCEWQRRYNDSMTTQEYEEIAHKMRPRLMQLGLSFFQDEEQAADAVQEALLRLWLLRERVNDTSHAKALLIKMTQNVCVSEWRHQQRQGLLTVEHLGFVLAEEAQPMSEDDNGRLLQQAIATLAPMEQRLFRMRHELGMDVAQIAAATGLLPRSVSAVVSKARHKIVEQLKKGGIL